MECLGSLAHRLEGPSLRSALQPVLPLLVHPRYGHPLRFYITPHFRKCRAVVALKLHLGPRTAARPDGFPKQALCKVTFAGDGRTAVGAPRSLVRPTRRRLHALVVCLRSGISQALRAVCLVSGLRPIILCVPPPARGPRRCAAWLRAELPVRPPRGLPQSALHWLCWHLTLLLHM